MKRPPYNSEQITRGILAQREAQRHADEARAKQAQEYSESQIRDLEERSGLINESLSLILKDKDPAILVNMAKARFEDKPLPLHCNDRSLDENTSGRDEFYKLANDLEYGLQLRGTAHVRHSLDRAKEPVALDGVEIPFHTKLAAHLFDRQLDEPKIEKAYDALQSLEAASTPEGELPSDVMAFLLIDVLVVNFERTQRQIEDKQQGNS